MDRLDRIIIRYKMEIGPDKTRVTTNNSNGFQREIKIKGQRLEEVENFKYLGAVISNEGSKPEILSRIAQTTAALCRLKRYGGTRTSRLLLKLSWCGRSPYLPSFMPVRAGPWQQKSREGSKPLRWDAIGDFWIFPAKTMWRTSRFAAESRMKLEWKRKLRWYGYISRSSGKAKTILQGTGKGARRRGRQKKRWEDHIKEWTGMGFGDSLRAAEVREGWKGIVATSSVVPRRPPRLRDWDEMRWRLTPTFYIKSLYNMEMRSERNIIYSSSIVWALEMLWKNSFTFDWSSRKRSVQSEHTTILYLYPVNALKIQIHPAPVKLEKESDTPTLSW